MLVFHPELVQQNHGICQLVFTAKYAGRWLADSPPIFKLGLEICFQKFTCGRCYLRRAKLEPNSYTGHTWTWTGARVWGFLTRISDMKAVSVGYIYHKWVTFISLFIFPWWEAIISWPTVFTSYQLHRPHQLMSLPHWTVLSGLKETSVSHCSFVSEILPILSTKQEHLSTFHKAVQRCSGFLEVPITLQIWDWGSWITLISNRW